MGKVEINKFTVSYDMQQHISIEKVRSTCDDDQTHPKVKYWSTNMAVTQFMMIEK